MKINTRTFTISIFLIFTCITNISRADERESFCTSFANLHVDSYNSGYFKESPSSIRSNYQKYKNELISDKRNISLTSSNQAFNSGKKDFVKGEVAMPQELLYKTYYDVCFDDMYYTITGITPPPPPEEKPPSDGLFKTNYPAKRNSPLVIKSETTYRNSKKDGIEKLYNERGGLSNEILYCNGIKEGLSKEYFPAGNLKKEIPFKNDKIEGVEITYTQEGMVEKETPYVDGQIHGKEKYYSSFNGTKGLSKEIEYVEGVKNGFLIKYYGHNNNLLAKTFFKDGKYEGKAYDYAENGTGLLKREMTYKDGKLDGIMKVYDSYKENKLLYEITFKDGVAISGFVYKGAHPGDNKDTPDKRELNGAEITNINNEQKQQ